jgi:hypothetical protein
VAGGGAAKPFILSRLPFTRLFTNLQLIGGAPEAEET